MPEFTPAQKQAIESTKGTILVSAAAGSGKTTVLVERVIRRLADKENPCPADSLLIVTFTRAATAQMKEKIAQAFEKLIEEDPSDEYLLKQRMLLPFAKISTIDSFCGELVRENFNQLGISPDFKMLEENELSVMTGEAVSAVLERAYARADKGFLRLAQMFVSGSSDKNLISLIISLYNNSRAFPYPDKWLDSLVEPYKNAADVMSCRWGHFIKDYLKSIADYCISMLTQAIELFEKNDSTVNESYSPEFTAYIKIFENVISTLETGSWDEVIHSLDAYDSRRRISLPRGYDSYCAQVAKSLKPEISNIVKDCFRNDIFCCTQAEFLEDNEYLLPAVEALVELVKEFDAEFSRLKNLADGADFSDVMFYALRLLTDGADERGNPIKTELARSLSAGFAEILVDEFQDINETQNMLFKAISKDETNLFMVGDVKQSIYNFRRANPEIFLNRRKALEYYKDGNYPAKINLDFNFRSRKGVTDYVNFVFSQLMSEQMGGLDYNSDETLKPKAVYPDHTDPDAEVHFVYNGDGTKIDRASEARYIADYIRRAMDSGMTVTDGGAQRPVSYRDFCILLRSVKNRADIYADVLNGNSIPCCVSSRTGFFDAQEIKTALALMRAVDNPMQDIPLAAVLISPVYGFTPDELSRLRCDGGKDVSYYSCVRRAAENGSGKCADFIESLNTLRNLSVTLGAGEFVREMLLFTGYDALVCSMTDGASRRANLSLLVDYAEKYEQSGHTGLSGFLRFIDKVRDQNGDFEIAGDISENADTVRIMSIHKSKGLEFPVCILADCSAKFNNEKSDAAFDPKYGIAFKRTEGLNRFETLAYKAVKTAHKAAERSEEMRVFYVALTRAKEKLVCVIRNDNPEKKLTEILTSPAGKSKIHPFRVYRSSTLAEWIMLTSVRHSDSSALPCVSAAGCRKTLPCESGVLFKISAVRAEGAPRAESGCARAESDEALIREIGERAEYVYPYASLSSLTAKISPSELEDHGAATSRFACAKPGFIHKDGMAAASRGTAVHKFMEFCDFTLPADSVRQQAALMVQHNKLTPAEEKVLDYPRITRFFESDIAGRMRSSERVEREKRVTFTVPAREIYGVDSDEEILVQGYIDCAFRENGRWVVVDYKTDKVSSVDELRRKYTNQLRMYERALRECTGDEVKETVIYSLYLNESTTL